MFGKKKVVKKEKEHKNIKVIPDDFYGAKDPVVHYEGMVKEESKKTIESRLKEAEKKAEVRAKKIIKKPGKVRGPGSGVKKKKVLYSLLAVALVLVVAAVSWYYIDQAQKLAALRAPEQPPEVEPVIEPEIEEEEIIEEEAVEEEEEIIEEEEIKETDLGPALEFPSMFLVDSADVDGDSLTDLEEEVFNVDSGDWDTDKDGYYDGQEVFNLYNPQGFAPMKIIDSGLVKEYVNPSWQYRVYYPSQWVVGEVDSQFRQVLFSSVTGDYVEISAFKKESGEDFTAWFIENAENQKLTDLQTIINRFKEEGKKRKDDLVAYFVQENDVYVMTYHPGATGPMPFRHIIRMMWQSFRPSKTFVEIPEQIVLPVEPTSTIEIGKPVLVEEATTTEQEEI